MSVNNDETPFNDSIETPEHQLKLVILGESAVGKTSFLHWFVDNNFIDKREPTVGAGFLSKIYRVDDSLVKINAWDTAGQERFHSLAPMYYRGAQAAIVMYDVTKEATFERAKAWIQELQRLAPAHIVITLVGNKLDLCDEELNNANNEQHSTSTINDHHQAREVSAEEASNYANENALLFFESSAKLNINIDAVFTKIVQNVSTEYLTPLNAPGRNRGSANNNATNENVDLNQEMNNARKSSPGCAC
ncbi:unnamed protein product [Cunninghamella blakesleeana]